MTTHPRRLTDVLLASLCLTLTTGHAAPPDDETAGRLRRAERIRAVLLEALEAAYANDGSWPDALPGDGADLVYTKPPTIADPLPFTHPASATVAVHEPPEAHAGGVWVGYADGHLEFAPDAHALAACKAQGPLVEQAVVYQRSRSNPPASAPATPPPGAVKVRVLDPAGRPVAGALVGVFGTFGNLFPDASRASFGVDDPADSNPVVTVAAGEAVVTGARAFAAKFVDQSAVPLWVIHEGRTLVAYEDLPRSAFAELPAATRDIRLAPACRVTGDVTSVGLAAVGRSLRFTACIPSRPGADKYYTLNSLRRDAKFELLLPPGDWSFDVYGTDCAAVHRYARIAPGQRTLHLNLDLPPKLAVQGFGKPAPEFRAIKGWKNGGPVTLAGLRGKVVVLDFWGYWCNPCCEAMPDLMKLYDTYRDRGLEVIAVHDDSVESVAEMDTKLARAREKQWAGRDLPFPVAIDGGGPTRIPYTATVARGATTAAYGVTSFPTTLLVAPDGTLVDDFDPTSRNDIALLERLLPKPAAAKPNATTRAVP